jgi:hypothetical protein
VIVTTNLPFSEWTTMFPNARLCKAMLDRLTDQAHIIETGNESYRSSLASINYKVSIEHSAFDRMLGVCEVKSGLQLW